MAARMPHSQRLRQILAAVVSKRNTTGGLTEQAYKHRARNAGVIRRSVVTAISCAFHTCTRGHGLAESPAFRAPLGISGLPDMPAKEGPRVLYYGRARAG
jgi:hypothetical protein